MSTDSEALLFLEETRPPLKHLFAAIQEREATLSRAIERLYDIAANLSPVVLEVESWARTSNWYSEGTISGPPADALLHRILRLDELRTILAPHVAGHTSVREILAAVRACEDSLGILAGAVLQVGKQVLAYRFGEDKTTLLAARCIYSQSIVDVIWFGRNHAMHWEEGKPRKPTARTLTTLADDSGIPLPLDKSTSYAILHLLNWNSEVEVFTDLSELVKLHP